MNFLKNKKVKKNTVVNEKSKAEKSLTSEQHIRNALINEVSDSIYASLEIIVIDKSRTEEHLEEGKSFLVSIYINETQMREPELNSNLKQVRLIAKNFNINEINVETVTLKELHVIKENHSEEEKNLETRTKMQKFAKDLFASASKQNASDVHIIVGDDVATIRFRVHGLLKTEREISSLEADTFIKTVYTTMTEISDTYFDVTKPQSARISDEKYMPKTVSGIRMATTGHTEGIYTVFRLLYKQKDINSMNLSELGYTLKAQELIDRMKKKPTGLNIIVGETGSGKSTTLQLILSNIIKETMGQKNVVTVEDPPEYPIEGAIQIPVTNAKSEEDREEAFNQTITAAMRLDPDIIMQGEMRDKASSKLGLRAAMTGHQVWTTLHANSVFGALDRLIDYEISLDMLADPMILTGIIYQKLVQTLCENCKISYYDLNEENYPDYKKVEKTIERLMKVASNEEINTTDVLKNLYFRGCGCEKCNNGPKGVTGRTVAAEILYPDDKILELIRNNEKEKAREYWFKDLKGSPVSYEAALLTFNGNVDPVMAEDKVGPLDSKMAEKQGVNNG